MMEKMINNQKYTRLSQSGMSLVELMIALLIGLLLSAAIITVYLSNKKTFWDSEAAASLQENSRFAMKLITQDLRLAGYYGGVDHKNITNKISSEIVLGSSCKMKLSTERSEYDYAVSMWVISAANKPGCIPNNVLAGGGKPVTDILFAKHVSKETSSGTDDDKTYMVSGLDNAGHFIGVKPTGLESHVAASGEYPGGEIREYIYHAYYISKVAGNTFPQLRRRTFSKDGWITETVADGIEDIHFKFGLDTDSDGAVEAYLDTGAVTTADAWDQVIAVKVYLLAQSTKSDFSFTDEKSYQYRIPVLERNSGNGYKPADHYHRKLYETTVTLFNNQMERTRGL